MKHILIIGLTSSPPGGMEYHNLGNYAIMEPLILGIKREFPGCHIATSIQMSDEFCRAFGVVSLRPRRFWTYGKETALATLADMGRIFLWRMFRSLSWIRPHSLLKRSQLLLEMRKADLIIDFSGDIFGDNAGYARYLEGCAEIIFAKLLGKPVVMLAGSPGPFKAWWRKILANIVFHSVDLITNREPISTEILGQLGVARGKMQTTACPAFLFKPKLIEEVQDILAKEKILPAGKRPLAGLILSGWNMPLAPNDKVPREPWELEPFAALVDHLITILNVRVLVMSHQNATDLESRLIPGSDHAIVRQLVSSLHSKQYGDNLLTLQGVYDAGTTKAIIGRFDMVISGRIHGAIGALSQMVPTVIIDYGHEPKAHKLRGFARLIGIERYLVDPGDSADMIRKTTEAWNKREEIRRMLHERIPLIQRSAQKNFSLLHEYC